MKNHINVITFIVKYHKQLFLATVLLLGLVGEAPPGC